MVFNGVHLAAAVVGALGGFFVPRLINRLERKRLREVAYENGYLHAQYLCTMGLVAIQLEQIRIGLGAYAPDFVKGFEAYFRGMKLEKRLHKATNHKASTKHTGEKHGLRVVK